jgi:[ribosomal protein S5]-alanine N-acetyltransferase
MKITTDRIDIVPLCLEELKVMISSRAEYEKKANCKVSGVDLPAVYCEELAEMLERIPDVWDNKSTDYLFYTLWVMIDRESKSIVGQFSFNGKPNVNGEVEVFFSIEKPFRRKGFATEVMEGILHWATESQLFKFVLIEADLENKAAMASLNKLGFKPVPVDEDDESITTTKYFRKVGMPMQYDDDFDFD